MKYQFIVHFGRDNVRLIVPHTKPLHYKYVCIFEFLIAKYIKHGRSFLNVLRNNNILKKKKT